jgi:hypothetical protein
VAPIAGKFVLENSAVDLGKILEPRRNKIGEFGAYTTIVTERVRDSEVSSSCSISDEVITHTKRSQRFPASGPTELT